MSPGVQDRGSPRSIPGCPIQSPGVQDRRSQCPIQILGSRTEGVRVPSKSWGRGPRESVSHPNPGVQDRGSSRRRIPGCPIQSPGVQDRGSPRTIAKSWGPGQKESPRTIPGYGLSDTFGRTPLGLPLF